MSYDLPPEFTPKKKKSGGVRNTFQSTVLGTAVFMAEMQRKVPLRTKLAVVALLVVLGGGGAFVWNRHRERVAAEEALATALTQPPAEGLPTLRTLVDQGALDDTGRIQAIARLGEAHDAAAVPALVSALSRSEEVRVAAADAIARIGAPAGQAAQPRLTELLHDAQVTNVIPFAWALAATGDASAAELVADQLPTGAPQALPSYDQSLLAATLGDARLAPRLTHADARVRQFAASSLGAHCEPTVVPGLAQATSDADAEVRQAAMVSLGRCGTPEALAALGPALERERGSWTALQTAFLAQAGAPAMTELIAHVEDAQARATMLTALASIADPRAGDALVQELERRPDSDARVRLQIGAALAEISDPRVAAVLETVVLEGEGEWPSAALEILGRSANAEDVEPLLARVARERSALRPQALAALATARACGDDARELYRRSLASDPSALRGLARCGDPAALATARTRLGQRVPQRGATRADEGAYFLAVLEAVALARASDLSPRLFEIATDADADPTLRSHAGAVLGVIGSDADLDAAADRVVDARVSPGVREGLVRALVRRVPSSALGRLMGYVRGGEDDERSRAATVIVGLAAGPELRTELVSLLGDARAKNHAALALALGGDDASAEALAVALAADGALQTALNQRLTELPREVVAERVVLDVTHGLRLRAHALGLALDRYFAALRASEAGPATPSAREVRRQLEALAVGADPAARLAADEALVGLGARGAVLALRQSSGQGADEARRVLR